MAIVENYPRSATAVSLADDTELLEIPTEELVSFLTEEPDQIVSMIGHLGGRLVELTQDYKDVSAVIRELKESEKAGEKESLMERIRKHVSAYKAKRPPVTNQSAEFFYDLEASSQSAEKPGKLVTYPAGTVICREGQLIRCMYEVQSGKVGVYAGYGTENEVKFTELFPQTFFGEIGLVLDEARSASVVALEDTTIEVIYMDDLKEMAKKNPPRAEMVLQHVSNRLRRLTDRYMEACALVYEAAEDKEKNEKMDPALAEKIKAFKEKLYD